MRYLTLIFAFALVGCGSTEENAEALPIRAQYIAATVLAEEAVNAAAEAFDDVAELWDALD